MASNYQFPGAIYRGMALLALLLCVACSTPPVQRSPSSSSPGGVAGNPPTANAPAGSAAGRAGTYGGSTSPQISAPLIESPSAGGTALRQGVAAFDMGEYGRAESKLNEGFKLGLTNTPDLLRGYKTQAFVYCITARTAQCERSFDAAFNINKKFNLTPGERQHPIWGPVFAKVQKRYPV
jgi:hypothetical protein